MEKILILLINISRLLTKKGKNDKEQSSLTCADGGNDVHSQKQSENQQPT